VAAPLFAPLGDSPVLAALGGEPDVHVVGGAVRDLLLGRVPVELDLVVEGDAVAVARRAAERLGGDVVVHDRFGTASVRAPGATFDLAGARAESYARPGALPDVRLGVPLADDLARRDFTVNAIAARVGDGELTAYPGALEDLEGRALRVLHDASFRDDPTRLLRLARYAARLGFAVEERTAALAAAAVRDGAVATPSAERMGAELRLLAREPQPAAVEALERFGLGAALLPGQRTDPALVERALTLAPEDARDDLVALGAGLAPGLDARLRELAFPAADAAILLAIAGRDALRAALAADGLTPSGVRRVLARVPVEAAVVLAAGEGAAAERARRWVAEWRRLRPAITGHDLLAAGLRGPAVGRALEAATDALLDGRAPDRDTQLAAALEAEGA
jgi:tRNA nucleotidyltransferase (CCA-adding enzyme)